MGHQIQVFNKIAEAGLRRFSNDYEISDNQSHPQAILLRSHSLHEYEFSEDLLAVARAGAGVNNIPIATCTDLGIVVFNTPGANANAVKELVIAGLILSSRNIIDGISWAKSLLGQGDEVVKLVEKGKSNYAGPEIQGKTLGVIGLGAIGLLVANAAESLGMKVVGYDPYLSVDSAWQLSKRVNKAPSLDALLKMSDYISIHVPLMDATRNFIDQDKLNLMKDGVRILNFARGGLVDESAIIEALNQNKVSYFITDFPNDLLLGHPKVIPFPHLGASTPESEENCAVMAVEQVVDYLENGNIRNSVNFPFANLPRTSGPRLVVINKNIPGVISQITGLLDQHTINISDMLNQHRDDLAYSIIDLDGNLNQDQLSKINEIEGVIRVRYLAAP